LNLNFFFFFCVSGLFVAELGVEFPLLWMLDTCSCFSWVVGVDGVDGAEGVMASETQSEDSQQSVIKTRGTVMSSGYLHGFLKCD
jgi:hypothetical protein